MLFEDNKILEFNQYQTPDKAPYIKMFNRKDLWM